MRRKLSDRKMNFEFFNHGVPRGFCPKSLTLHGITIFLTLVMPKPLTWSIAEMESSLYLCNKSPIFRFRPNLKSNTVWKKPNFARFFWVLPSKKFSKHLNKTALFVGCDSPDLKPCNVEFHKSYVFCLSMFISIVVKLQQTSDLTSSSSIPFSTVLHLVDRYCTAQTWIKTRFILRISCTTQNNFEIWI